MLCTLPDITTSSPSDDPELGGGCVCIPEVSAKVSLPLR